jgi:hypothetical protein
MLLVAVDVVVVVVVWECLRTLALFGDRGDDRVEGGGAGR